MARLGGAVNGLRKDAGADEPVGFARGLAEPVLLDHDPERVGDVLIECARLTGVAESRGVLGDTVRQLVTDHIE